MRVLVTGGAGFIGSTLVDRLLSDGDEVTVVDNLSRGRLDNLIAATGAKAGSLRVVATDLGDRGLGTLVAEVAPEVVFHLAAQIDVRASIADPVGDATVNVLGTVALAEAARAAGVRKIVFASSGGSIYGPDAPLPVTETAALHPLSPYSVSKICGELYLDAFSRLHGLQCTHLAFANVYGPRQDANGEAGVVAIFAGALLTGRQTQVFGDGGNTRDYVYVADVVSALRLASGELADRCRLNIGTGVQTTDRELHTMVARAVGVPDEPMFGPERRGDLRHSALDSALAGRVLGWRPEHDLRRGIALTVQSWRAQLS
ncbi:MAG TPA: NAD-dependent epimerase/dehydratase family protein [Mycobacterium sp.]